MVGAPRVQVELAELQQEQEVEEHTHDLHALHEPLRLLLQLLLELTQSYLQQLPASV